MPAQNFCHARTTQATAFDDQYLCIVAAKGQSAALSDRAVGG
jgi:hypothetical protein